MFESTTANPNMRVRRLLIQETGTYNRQYRRPFELNSGGGNISSLQEMVDSGVAITGATLAQHTPSLILPASVVESEIEIPGGWNERRARFMMEIEIKSNMSTVVEIITGFTDFVGFNKSGAIANDMVFYINNVIQSREMNHNTPRGMVTNRSVYDASQVLTNFGFDSIGNSVQQHLLRPMDVFRQQDMIAPELRDVTDTRTVLTMRPNKSIRRNAVPTCYAARLLENMRSAALTNRDGMTFGDAPTINAAAAGSANEPLCSKDPFMRAIGGIMDTTNTSSFSWRDLVTLDPNVQNDQITHVQFLSQTGQAMVHTTGQTDAMGGSGPMDQVAALLSNSIPALMMETGLTFLQMLATNTDDTGFTGVVTDRTSPTKAKAFGSADMATVYPAFEQRLIAEVLRPFSNFGQIPYTFEVICDLVGETRLRLKFDASDTCEYVTPSFADSMFSPVLTGRHSVKEEMAKDFAGLFSEVIPSNNQKFLNAMESGVNEDFSFGVGGGSSGSDASNYLRGQQNSPDGLLNTTSALSLI